MLMLSPEGALGVLRMVEIIDGLKAKPVEIVTQWKASGSDHQYPFLFRLLLSAVIFCR
jgi:hypothetical protein